MAVQGSPLPPSHTLPTELWEQVFEELPYDDLKRCILTCQQFSEIGLSVLSRYKKWLTSNAFVCVTNSLLSVGRTLKMIRRYHRAWEELPLQPLLVNGVYHTISSQIRRSRETPVPLVLENGWFCVRDFVGGLLFLKLPTLSSSTKIHRRIGWSFAKQLAANRLPPYADLRFDPSQDLLILLGPSDQTWHPDIHVLSISTGLKHPHAAFATLERGLPIGPSRTTFRVHGDLCAIVADSIPAFDDRILHVWDWKTGQLLLTRNGLDAWGDLVAFLGDRRMLLVQESVLYVCTFGNERSQTTFRSLRTPRFHDEALQLWTTVSQPYSSRPEPGRAWACDPASEIVVINMVRQEVDSTREWSIFLAIPVGDLLGYAEQFRSHGPEPVPWERWGPRSTRFYSLPQTWETPSTFGRRCLVSTYINGVPTLVLLDFGVETRHVGPQRYNPSPDWGVTVLPALMIVNVSAWFEDHTHLVMGLPCRVRSRAVPEFRMRVTGATLWENGIVLKLEDLCRIDYVSLPLIS